jgi:hypothetical protein
MPHYLVRWEIDLQADSPQEAAEKARARIRSEGHQQLRQDGQAIPRSAIGGARGFRRSEGQRMSFKRLTIIIEGNEDSDLELTIDEIKWLIAKKFTSGYNHNETAAFIFDIDEYVKEKQLDW